MSLSVTNVHTRTIVVLELSGTSFLSLSLSLSLSTILYYTIFTVQLIFGTFLEPGRFNRHSRKPLVLGKRDPNEKVTIKTDELVIVILVLCIWCGIICLFIKKWGKIRAIEPCQSYFSPEIYDIPLKKSTNGGSNGDLSNTANGHESSQMCPSNTGDGIGASAGGTLMASTESRRSLTTSMTIAAAAAATMAANASITGGHRRDSYPRFLGSPSPSSFCSYSKTTRNVYARVSGAVASTGELLQSWHICPFGLVVVFLAVVA